MEYQFVQYEVTDRIGYITLNRPEKRNALNAAMVGELKAAFERAEEDEQVKVIVLKANGEAFSAGADLEYLQQLQHNTYDENLQDSSHLMELFKKIYTNKKLVIAQIEGHAIAGGCGLATVCDLTFSVPEAKFGYTEVKIGFIPAIVMVFLIRKIGEAKAKELLFTGDLISAEQAVDKGMINFIAEKEAISKKVRELALNICSSASGDSLRLTKQMIARVQDLQYEDALQYAAEMNAEARATADCKKGIAAFLNKDKISW